MMEWLNALPVMYKLLILAGMVIGLVMLFVTRGGKS